MADECSVPNAERQQQWDELLLRVKDFYHGHTLEQHKMECKLDTLAHGLQLAVRDFAQPGGVTLDEVQVTFVGILQLGFYLGYWSAKNEAVH